MSSKRNVVYMRIAYQHELVNRESMNVEIDFITRLNKLLDMHKELGIHQDWAMPQVTHMHQGNYGCQINLQFHTKHGIGKVFNYPRLHHLLVEIADLCNEFEPSFERMEKLLDMSGMTEPWALVAGTAQVLVRKGVAQYAAQGNEIPTSDGTALGQQINGLTVMGEPTAVHQFTRAWKSLVRKHWESLRPDEIEAHNRGAVDLGPRIDVRAMKQIWPDLAWHHLLVWVHAVGMDGQGAWYVNNLDANDQFVLASVKYVHRNMINMMETPLDYAPLFGSFNKDMRFFKKMEYMTFEDHTDNSIDPRPSVSE